MSDKYNVGYGKPPVSTRFKKGQSGNPAGRKKGSRNLSTMVSDALNQRVVINEGGRTRSITKLEAAFAQQANQAARGDARATKLMLELLHAAETREDAKATGGDVTSEARRALDAKILQSLRVRMQGGGDDDA